MSETYGCLNCGKDFSLGQKEEDFFESHDLPIPVLCPRCRMEMKYAWINPHTFYKRTCDLCNKEIFSHLSKAYPAPVYCDECWHSENWTGMFYRETYNPEKPFFEQFEKLLKSVPHPASIRMGEMNIGSTRMSCAAENTDSKYIFWGEKNFECQFCDDIFNAKSVYDSVCIENSELCYECIDVKNSKKIFWGEHVRDSSFSYFVKNCKNVKNCFGCVNLENVKFMFFNEQLEEEMWTKKVYEILGNREKIEEMKERFIVQKGEYPTRKDHNENVTASSGEHVEDSKTCEECFEVVKGEESMRLRDARNIKNSLGVVCGKDSEGVVESIGVYDASKNILGSWFISGCSDIAYSYGLKNCNDCLGCAGLKHSKHCILNKEYSEDEYNELKKKIFEELENLGILGVFFPPMISPWGYNETLGDEEYPKNEDVAEEHGYKWLLRESREEEGNAKKEKDIPFDIKEVRDALINEKIACETCGHAFGISPEELSFYRKMLIPIPLSCPSCRRSKRRERRGAYEIKKGICVFCGDTVKTIYDSRRERVHCNECFERWKFSRKSDEEKEEDLNV